MTAHRDEHLDLCAAWALGSIDEADHLELERHLADGCPECERALTDFGASIERLAASAPPAMPGPGVRAAVLEQVRAEAARSDHPRAERVAPRPVVVPAAKPAPRPSARPAPVALTWTFAAAAVFLAVSTIATWRMAEQLRGELRGARERIARAEIELAAERDWAAIATRPGTRVVDLAPLTGGRTLPQVRVTYDPGSRRAIIAFESLAPPAGSDFELWAVDREGPRSLGVVRPDAGGRAVVRVADAGDPAVLAAFALSLERAGGSSDPHKPGGPVVLVGSVKS